MNLFFSLESIFGQTHNMTDQTTYVKKNRTLCYEYKYDISLEVADVSYVAICCCWYSYGVANEARLQKLENWFIFWHFHVRQWGGFLIQVFFSTFSHISSLIPFSQVHI
jgi:hypothetical protein